MKQSSSRLSEALRLGNWALVRQLLSDSEPRTMCASIDVSSLVEACRRQWGQLIQRREASKTLVTLLELLARSEVNLAPVLERFESGPPSLILLRNQDRGAVTRPKLQSAEARNFFVLLHLQQSSHVNQQRFFDAMVDVGLRQLVLAGDISPSEAIQISQTAVKRHRRT